MKTTKINAQISIASLSTNRDELFERFKRAKEVSALIDQLNEIIDNLGYDSNEIFTSEQANAIYELEKISLDLSLQAVNNANGYAKQIIKNNLTTTRRKDHP